jgi:hypothetical protein
MPIFLEPLKFVYCFSIQKQRSTSIIIKKFLEYFLRKLVRDIRPPQLFNDGIIFNFNFAFIVQRDLNL